MLSMIVSGTRISDCRDFQPRHSCDSVALRKAAMPHSRHSGASTKASEIAEWMPCQPLNRTHAVGNRPQFRQLREAGSTAGDDTDRGVGDVSADQWKLITGRESGRTP